MLGGPTASSSPVTISVGQSMIGFLRLPQRRAGAGKTLRILAHMALAHKRNRHGIIVGGGAGQGRTD
jgi:hypothetical protein